MFWFVLLLWILGVRGNTSTTELKNLTTASTATTVTEETVTQTTKSTEIGAPIDIVDGFSSLENGISSGNIMITDNRTFHISNFHFDGTPNCYFLVGRGNVISENGTFVPVSGGGVAPLSAYDGQDIVLTLPKNLGVGDIDWLAIWSKTSHRNLTLVFLKKESRPPQTFHLSGEVTSSPIVLVDKKTLFVPSFRYKGDYKDVHFWVWNGSEPATGMAVLDEKGTAQSLHSYEGQNLNLNLPDGVSTDNTENFGVWSKDAEHLLGSTQIKGIPNVPEADGRKTKILLAVSPSVVKVPKCCPDNSVLTLNGCENRTSLEFKPKFKVYEHNETHFRNESLDLSTIQFDPYYTVLQCSDGKFSLDEKNDQFAILLNGSLLVKGAVTGIFSGDDFCLEYIQPNNNPYQMKIFVCVPDDRKIQTAMYVTYVTFTIISTFCFAITFFVYVFWLKIEDIHRKCFTGYVLAMTLTFLSLTIVQTANVENGGCQTLGFLFQLFMIASFTMLGVLCVDIYIIVKYIDDNVERRKRTLWYLGVSLGVPILSLIVSLSRNLTPDVPNSFFKPQYQKNFCSFDAQSQRTTLFYLPIATSILVSIVCLVLTKLKIVENDRKRKNDYFWLDKGTTYKFMWRKHFIIVLTSLMWFVEALIHLNFADSANMLMAIDIVEASQGILVLLLFVVNKQTRTHIIKNIKKRRRKKNNFNHMIREEEIIMHNTQ